MEGDRCRKGGAIDVAIGGVSKVARESREKFAGWAQAMSQDQSWKVEEEVSASDFS